MKIVESLTNSAVFVAISAMAYLLGVATALGTPVDLPLLVIGIALPFSAYSLNRLSDQEDQINKPGRNSFFRDNRRFAGAITVLAYVLALGLAIQRSLSVAVYVFVILFIVYLYSRSKKNNSNERQLKSKFLLKNVTVSLAWCSVASLLAVYNGYMAAATVFFVTFYTFFDTMVNSTLLDIGDIEGDRKYNVKTIPVVLGVQNTKKVLYGFVFLSALSIILGVFIGALKPFVLAGLVPNAMYVALIARSSPQNNREAKTEALIDAVDSFVFLGCLLIAKALF